MIEGTWAVVEMLGHRQVVGQLSEITVAGAAMLRIDVPSEPPGVVIAAPASLYCITPIDEERARARAHPAARADHRRRVRRRRRGLRPGAPRRRRLLDTDVAMSRYVVAHPAGCDPVKLTDSMARALLVVHRHDGRARVSNVTAGQRVYWQAANRLRDRGLIHFTVAGPNGADGLALTPLGTRVVYELEAGMVVGS